MKVDVLTIDDVKVKRWSWWSSWVDVCVYNYSFEAYLIQMKMSRSNKKKFRSVRVTGRFYKQLTTAEVGDLTQMKREAE